MKIEISKEIMRRFLVCVEYTAHSFSCNEGIVKSTKFLKIPNCPFLDVCEITNPPIAQVVKIFEKALSK